MRLKDLDKEIAHIEEKYFQALHDEERNRDLHMSQSYARYYCDDNTPHRELDEREAAGYLKEQA